MSESMGDRISLALRRGEAWEDLYAPGGVRHSKRGRCPAVHPDWMRTRCMNARGHDGAHRYTSSVDGRSVTWP